MTLIVNFFGGPGVGKSTLASGTHTVTGSITATGDITGYYSDDNLKNKLGTIDNALDKLMTLTGFYYEANETPNAQLIWDLFRVIFAAPQSHG